MTKRMVHVSIFLPLLMGLFLLISPTTARAASAHAHISQKAVVASTLSHTSSTHFCQCVEFVNDYTGLNIQANARDWPAYLPDAGYFSTSTPIAGEIVTYPATVDGAGDAGHVAIIDSISSVHGNTYTLHLLGANQGNSGWFTFSTCNNVNYTDMFATPGDGSQYWYQSGDN